MILDSKFRPRVFVVADQIRDERASKRPKTPSRTQIGDKLEPLIGLVASGDVHPDALGDGFGAALERAWGKQQ